MCCPSALHCVGVFVVYVIDMAGAAVCKNQATCYVNDMSNFAGFDWTTLPDTVGAASAMTVTEVYTSHTTLNTSSCTTTTWMLWLLRVQV